MNQKKDTLNLSKEETEGARRATGVSSLVLEVLPSDPEVRPKETRRRLTRAYKLNILEQADQCTENGSLGALLRREGLYSSQLALWRKQRREGFFEKAQRRGRPGMSHHEKEQKQRVRDLEKKVQSVIEHRNQVRQAARQRIPERFKGKNVVSYHLSTEVWINPPESKMTPYFFKRVSCCLTNSERAPSKKFAEKEE